MQKGGSEAFAKFRSTRRRQDPQKHNEPLFLVVVVCTVCRKLRKFCVQKRKGPPIPPPPVSVGQKSFSRSPCHSITRVAVFTHHQNHHHRPWSLPLSYDKQKRHSEWKRKRRNRSGRGKSSSSSSSSLSSSNSFFCPYEKFPLSPSLSRIDS